MARFDHFGKAIVALRRERRWSQKELAREAGISAAMLSNYENGVKKPTLDNLGKILDAFDLYLGRFDDALDLVSDRPPRGAPEAAAGSGPGAAPEGVDLPRFLGADPSMRPDLEPAFAELVRGFQAVARHLYLDLTTGRRKPS